LALSKLRIQLQNTSVLFLIEADLILSNDDLRDTVDCDISECYETVSEIKTELLTVERQRKEFISIAQLQQIDLFLLSLEFKLRTFKQML